MVEEVDLSPNAIVRSRGMARAIQYAAGIVGEPNGWVLPTSHAHNDLGVEFDATHTASSLDVDIDGGIGFVAGKHLRTDSPTQVTLAGSTADQTVYLGWPASAGDSVIVGLADAFPADHEKLALWTFTTDATGVSSASDERQLEYPGADLGDGAAIGRALFTALADDAVGTPGDSLNEIFRAAGTVSDLVLTMEGGEGRFNLGYNTYFDGSDWRAIAANQPAFRMRMTDETGRVQFMMADGVAADAIQSWFAFGLDVDGDLLVYPDGAGGEAGLFYDISHDVIPKVRLGGPASELSSYPLPPQDISDGPGSGLDADTVDGFQPADLGGEWEHIVTNHDADAGSVTDFNTGMIAPQFDFYRVTMTLENQAGANDFNMRINGFPSGYHQISHDHQGFITRSDVDKFQDFCPVNGTTVAHCVAYASGPVHRSTSSERTLSATSTSQFDQPTILGGNHAPDVGGRIDNFRIWTASPAQTVIEIHAKNF